MAKKIKPKGRFTASGTPAAPVQPENFGQPLPLLAQTVLPFLNEKIRLGILVLIAILVYVNTFTHQYALDDTIVLQKNLHVQEGLSGISKILKREPFQNDFGNERLRKRYYRQLSIVSFAVEHQFFGENPTVSHILNVLFYAGLIAIMYKLLRKYFFASRPDIAFFSALLFAVHPIHTEVVANIKSRDEIFCFIFCLSALYLAFKYYKGRGSTGNLVGSLICYFLALLSKENAIVFFAVFPLSFYWFTGRTQNINPSSEIKSAFSRSLPFMGVLGFYFLFRAGASGIDTSVEQFDLLHNRFYGLSFFESLPTKFYFWLIYIKLLIIPYPLIWDYSYNAIGFISYSDPLFWVSVSVFFGLLGFGLWGIRTKNPAAYGILFFMGTLFLVSGLVINIGGYFAERFLFQPSFGFAIAVGVLVGWLCEKKFTVPALAVFSALILTGCSLTFLRNPDWKNNETLFGHDAPLQPNSALAQKAWAGMILSKTAMSKDTVQQRASRDAAYKYYIRAYEIYPRYADALINLGLIHFLNNDFPKAEKYWSELKKWYPTHPQLRENHDLLYNKLLSFANDAFNKKEMETYMQYSLRAYPFADETDEKVPLNMGLVYRDMEKIDSAIKYLRIACEIKPGNPEYWFTLGQQYARQNRIKEGKEAFTKTLQLQPQHAGANYFMNNAPPEK